MIGVVVVTHGQLATELVNAAETIVGDLPNFAAVSIGWHEDVQDARDDDRRGHRARQAAGRRAARHRHVWRHAVEPRHHISRTGQDRDRHRREPADADQGGQPARSAASLTEIARIAARARAQRHLGGVRSADGRVERGPRGSDDRRENDGSRVRDSEPAGSARASRGEVRPHGDAVSRRRFASAATAGRWTARASWASCCWRPPPARRSSSRPTARTKPTRSTRCAAWSKAASERNCGAPERHRRLARRRGRPRGDPDAAHGGDALPDPAGSRGPRSRRRCSARARNHGSSCRTFARASRRAAAANWRRFFDAQILMLDDPMLVGRAEEIVRSERVNAAWAVHRAYEELDQLFSGDGRSVPARARERRRRRRRPPAHEPAPRRARTARAAEPDRRSVGPDRRRAHRVGGRATRLDARAGLCHRRRQPHVSHGDPRALAEGAGHRRPA